MPHIRITGLPSDGSNNNFNCWNIYYVQINISYYLPGQIRLYTWHRSNIEILTLDPDSTWKTGPYDTPYMTCWHVLTPSYFSNNHETCYKSSCWLDMKVPSSHITSPWNFAPFNIWIIIFKSWLLGYVIIVTAECKLKNGEEWI